MITTIIFDIGNVLLEPNPTTPKMVSIIPESIMLLNELSSKKYPLFAITDASASTLQYEWSTFEFYQKFQDVITSHEAKSPKSHPQIFKYFLEKHHLIAEECVFIDDRIENVESALKAHLSAIHFTNASNCRKSLIKLGIQL